MKKLGIPTLLAAAMLLFNVGVAQAAHLPASQFHPHACRQNIVQPTSTKPPYRSYQQVLVNNLTCRQAATVERAFNRWGSDPNGYEESLRAAGKTWHVDINGLTSKREYWQLSSGYAWVQFETLPFG